MATTPLTMAHTPLPYLVTLTIGADADRAPQRHVVRVVAYALMEAAGQAVLDLMTTTGLGADASAIRVESVRPDLLTYALMTHADAPSPCPDRL